MFGLFNRQYPFGLPAQQPQQPQQLHNPAASYGVNDTGRTTPFAPNPTFAAGEKDKYKGPTWAYPGPQYTNGGGQQSGGLGGGAGGLLGMLFGMSPEYQNSNSPFARMFMNAQQKQQGQPLYEAALRERPEDIQRIVSMTRGENGQTFDTDGFLGGLFGKKG
jgi:hypothetical protein